MKWLKYITLAIEIFKLIKNNDVKETPKTVVVQAPTQEAASAIADKIAKDDPEVEIAVSAVTAAGVSKLEDLITKKILKK